MFFSQTTVDVIRGWLLLHIGSCEREHHLYFLDEIDASADRLFDAKTTGDCCKESRS
jgi:hypothetical protein